MKSLAGRPGLDREGVHAVREILSEKSVDQAVPFNARAIGEGRRRHAHAKVRFAAVASLQMASMTRRFVKDFEKDRGEADLKLGFNSFFDGHASILLIGELRCRPGLPLRPVAPNLFWMNLNSPLFDRIRMKSSPKQPVERPRCDYPGCAAEGGHRAPMGRLREGQYFCFCLEHVRAYNHSYNYFSGMSDSDVAKFQRDAETGHRPTWTMGVNRAARGLNEGAPSGGDPLGASPFGGGARPEPAPRPRYGLAALKALEVLGLDERADAEGMKARYKELVKRLHPDANGGDRSSEDRLREIIHAYNYLRSAKLV